MGSTGLRFDPLVAFARRFGYPNNAGGTAPASLPAAHLLQGRVSGVAVPLGLGANFVRSVKMQRCSFSVTGPTTWKELPQTMRHPSYATYSQYPSLLKTTFSRLTWDLEGRYTNVD